MVCCNNLMIYILSTHIYLYLHIYIYTHILFIYRIIHLLQVKITETSERGTLLGAKHVHQMNELQLCPLSKKRWKNHWTPDLTLDWCRAPYMSCVSNIYFSWCFVVFSGANRSKRRCISLGSKLTLKHGVLQFNSLWWANHGDCCCPLTSCRIIKWWRWKT